MRTYIVAGMKCDGCARAVERAVRARVMMDVPVEVNLDGGTVRVGHDADPEIVNGAIARAGYRVERVDEEYLI